MRESRWLVSWCVWWVGVWLVCWSVAHIHESRTFLKHRVFFQMLISHFPFVHFELLSALSTLFFSIQLYLSVSLSYLPYFHLSSILSTSANLAGWLVREFRWLAGCLVGRLVREFGWLASWLVGRLVGWSVSWLACCASAWPMVGCLAGEFALQKYSTQSIAHNTFNSSFLFSNFLSNSFQFFLPARISVAG